MLAATDAVIQGDPGKGRKRSGSGGSGSGNLPSAELATVLGKASSGRSHRTACSALPHCRLRVRGKGIGLRCKSLHSGCVGMVLNIKMVVYDSAV